MSVRQKETAPQTKRSHDIEAEEKKWEEKSGKNKRERYKKYLVTKNNQSKRIGPGKAGGREKLW